jgi:hypothetical protein
VKRGDKTLKDNYTKRAPKGKWLSLLGGCPIPRLKEMEMVVH